MSLSPSSGTDVMSAMFAHWIYTHSKLLTAPVPTAEGGNSSWSQIIRDVLSQLDHMGDSEWSQSSQSMLLVTGSYIFSLLSLVLLL
jgi:hypothetical protein